MKGKTGSGQPPRGRPFQKGHSGNPKGRPKKTRRAESASAFDVIVDKTLTITRDGRPREVSVEEALQHKTYQEAIAGSRAAQRMILKMIAKREAYLAARAGEAPVRPPEIRYEPEDPSNADAAMLLLGIACRNPANEDVSADREQLLLEPWAVQAALSRRRGGKKLDDRDIKEIRRCTRDPDTLRWPRGTKP